MATFELVILMTIAVLISAILEKVIPRVSLPLIQIALGIAIAVCGLNPSLSSTTLDPEFFLVLFIAPLLYRDAKDADKLALWKNARAILSLAIGLVLAIVLIVGFSVNAMEPSIPLAAAFALGAALGPTDAVAVSSLSSTVSLSRRENALLSGESLLNDASGVVAFQFAVAAAVTGTFSLADATLSFVVEFVGGIVFGLIAGWLAHWVQAKLRDGGLDSTTFHVMFDVSLPFIIFLSADKLHFSGIIAVVAAALVMSSIQDRKVSPNISQISIVNTSVWNVLAFILNGLVFVLMGIQLPQAFSGAWEDVGLGNGTLIAYVLAITAILIVVRLIWVLAMGAHQYRRLKVKKPAFADRFNSALITTIGGPKGAVTLSVIFSTPYYVASGDPFPQRHLIIFLASGVILVTLALANFLLPLLAPVPKKDEDAVKQSEIEAKIDIMRRVIERLSAERTKDNALATSAVLASYNHRIERIQDNNDIENETTTELRIDVINHEIEYLYRLIDARSVDEYQAYIYVRRLNEQKGYLAHRDERRIDWQRVRHANAILRGYVRSFLQKLRNDDDRAAQLDISERVLKEAIRYLHGLMESDDAKYPTETITTVLLSYQNSYRALRQHRPSVTNYTRVTDRIESVERKAYNFELEEIQNALEAGTISRKYARSMRDNVYLMMVDLEMDE